MSKAVINRTVDIINISGFQQNIQKNEESDYPIISLTIRMAEEDDPNTLVSLEEVMMNLAPYFEDESIECIEFFNNEDEKIYESLIYDKIKEIDVNTIVRENDLVVEKQISFEKIIMH